jgi:hypothetical protein
MTYVAGAIILLVSLPAYVYLISCILPSLLIKPMYNSGKIRDRGIKKCIFENGRAIVYNPDINIKKYVDQYVLFDDGEKKCLQCKVDDSVSDIKLRILTFDACDKPLGVFIARDYFLGKNTTGVIELPIETAYVSVEVVEINSKRVFLETKVSFSAIRLALYTLSSVIMTVAEAMFIKIALLMLADKFFDYSNAVGAGNAFTVFTAILIGFVSSVLIILSYNSKVGGYPLKNLIDSLVSRIRSFKK